MKKLHTILTPLASAFTHHWSGLVLPNMLPLLVLMALLSGFNTVRLFGTSLMTALAALLVPDSILRPVPLRQRWFHR